MNVATVDIQGLDASLTMLGGVVAHQAALLLELDGAAGRELLDRLLHRPSVPAVLPPPGAGGRIRPGIRPGEVQPKEIRPDELRSADELLGEIIRLDSEARRAARRSARRLARPGPFYRLGDGWLDDPRRGLAPWLRRLRRQTTQGRWKDASRGLSRWRVVADATKATAARIAADNGAALRRRDELRGLFGAWEAKATRLSLSEDPTLAGLAAATRRALFTAPTGLDGAARLVDEYGAALSARSSLPRAGSPADESRESRTRPPGIVT